MNRSLISRPLARFACALCTLSRLGLCAIVLAASQPVLLADVPPLYLTKSSVPGLGVNLVWDPSPDSNVVGYFLCWGTASGQCTNQLNARNATMATVHGFTTNAVYYFNVVAYNALGQQADPSNEVQFSGMDLPAFLGPTLGVPTSMSGSSSRAICLSFQASAGATYAVLATQDFIQWDTLWKTNCPTDTAVVFIPIDLTNYLHRFYRIVQTN
jgi:hypothetical protein